MRPLLIASLLLNVVLVGWLLFGGGARTRAVTPTAKETHALDGLVLAMRCGEGNREACAEKQARDRAGCDGGDGHACVLLGIASEVGREVAKDEAQAVKLYEKGCELGNGPGCWYAGSRHLQGRGTPRDVPLAISYLRRACDQSEKNGCLDLGDAYQALTPPDKASALAAYDRGCALGYDWACNRARDLRGSTGASP
jgi:TPR repeat protein